MHYKETPAQNITFIALMAGINVIFCLLFRFLPLTNIIFTLILPFVSTLVVIFCKAKYAVVYAFATLILTALISPQDAMFYILSPMMSGIVFGICFKHKLPNCWAIILGSITSVIVYYITMPLITLIFGVSLHTSFQQVFNLTTEQANNIFPSFVLITSSMQTILSFYIINNDLKKYLKLEESKTPYHILSGVCIGTSALSILLMFFYFPLGLVFMFSSIFLLYYPLSKIIKRRKYWIIIVGFILSVFGFAFLYPLINDGRGICLLTIFCILMSVSEFFFKNVEISDISI